VSPSLQSQKVDPVGVEPVTVLVADPLVDLVAERAAEELEAGCVAVVTEAPAPGVPGPEEQQLVSGPVQ